MDSSSLSLPAASIAAFALLMLALACLWAPRVSADPRAARVWIVPAALALILALAGGLIDWRGANILIAFAAACIAASRTRDSGALLRIPVFAVMFVIGAGLYLHAFPGIDNPLVINRVVISPFAAPYTKYLNFDKGFAALCLLGLYAPELPASDEGARHIVDFLWRFALVAIVVIALAFSLGYVRWDPKLPSWWPLWLWSMTALTALPEETVFRGLLLRRQLRDLDTVSPAWATPAAIFSAGWFFGMAHIAGGEGYVLLATAAGIGYGWVFVSTRSIGAAILTHVGVNAIHFVFFTYPALAFSRPGV